MNQLRRLIVGSVLLGGTALLYGSGCTLSTGESAGAVDGYAYVRADGAPEYAERYPHTRYHGRDAYYVDGRWYWSGEGGGWYVFNDEPRELHRWRTEYYNHTPGYAPARPPPAWGGGPGGGPPMPATPEPPGVQRPPPAY